MYAAEVAPMTSPPPPKSAKKKVVIRRVKKGDGDGSSRASSVIRGAEPDSMEVHPSPERPTAAETLMRKRQQGRLKKFDVLGDMGDFEAELASTLPPPPPAAPPPDRHTYDISKLPEAVQEAVQIAPDDGVSLIRAYESLLAEREQSLAQMTTLRETRQGQMLSADLYGTKTWTKNRYPDGHPTGTLNDQKKLKALKRWEKQQKVWQAQEDSLVAKTGAPPQTLAMSQQRAQEYRNKKQTINHFTKAIPLHERGLGPVQWYMSLREGWTRFVPVGNLFSGLFVAVEERPVDRQMTPVEGIHKLADLDRPETPLGTMSTKAKLETLRDRSLTVRGRAWAQGEYLNYRTRLYQHKMKKLVPVVPEYDALAVKGEGMEQAIWEQAQALITLEDVEIRLRMQDPGSFDALQAARAQKEEDERLEQERRREELRALASMDTSIPKEGPAMRLGDPRLVMLAEAGDVARCSLRVQNNGSCALYYNWQGKMRDLAHHAKAGGTYQVERFYLSDQSGMMLPGEVKHFVFSFKSDQPGIYEADWSVATHPALPDGPALVALRGVSTERDTKKLQRRLFNADLTQKHREQQVATALERVLRGVHTPKRPPPVLTEEQQAEADLFFSANTEFDGPELFYVPASFRAMAGLYAEARVILKPKPTEEEAAATTKAAGKDQPVEDLFEAEVWPGSVSLLKEIVAAVAEKADADPEVVEGLNKALDSAVHLARVPRRRHEINQFAMREMLQGVVGAMSDLANPAMEEAVSREGDRLAAEEADSGVAKKDVARKGKDEPLMEPYNREEFIELLEGTSRPATARTVDKFEQLVMRRDIEIAEHLDGLVSTANGRRDEAPGLADYEAAAWEKFALLRQRKSLRLPGGPEKGAINILDLEAEQSAESAAVGEGDNTALAT